MRSSSNINAPKQLLQHIDVAAVDGFVGAGSIVNLMAEKNDAIGRHIDSEKQLLQIRR